MTLNMESIDGDLDDFHGLQNPAEYLNLNDKEEAEKEGKEEIPDKHKEDVYAIYSILVSRRNSNRTRDNYDTRYDISKAFKTTHPKTKDSHVDYLISLYFDEVGKVHNKKHFEFKKQYVLPNPELFGPPETSDYIPPEEISKGKYATQPPLPKGPLETTNELGDLV